LEGAVVVVVIRELVVWPAVGLLVVLVIGTGAGSPKASTQYDCSTLKLPQLAVIEGF